MAKMINLIIDDQPVSVPAGTLIVNAAKLIGNDIPVFCYHPKMEPVGMCRMCLVDIGRPVIDRATGQPVLNEDGTPKIQFGPKLDTACTTPVSEGMVVHTSTQKVTDGRRDILEFLLTSHPLDCPICDKGGECPLQNLTLRHGPGKSRFLLDNKIHLAKHYPLGDLIYLDRERCIQCARCVRFQSELAGDPVIGFSQRGRSLEIVSYSEPGFDSYFSGNTTDICPVGALTSADFRFGARPWELKPVASICTQCPVGCNLTVNVRREAVSSGKSVVKRVMPRQNEEVNEIWICDKGRFAYHFAESQDRVTDPLIRRNGQLVKTTWDEAYDFVAQKLRAAGSKTTTLVGGRLANEDLFNLRKLSENLGGTAALYSDMDGGEWVARIGLAPGSNIGDMGPETAILVVASDLENEAPVWYLRLRSAAKRGAKLIVINPRATKLDNVAAHIMRYAYGEEVTALRSFLPGTAVPDAWKAAVEAAAGAENMVVFFGSEGLGLDGTRAVADACAAVLLAAGHTGKPNNGLVGVWPKSNLQGAFDMGFRPLADLKGTLVGSGAVYIAAADPAGDSPELAKALEQAAFVAVQDFFLTPTALLADVVLPAQTFIEREGTFTSGERRIQRFYAAVAPFAGPRPDFRIAGDIARCLGFDVECRAASLVFQRIAAEVPDYGTVTYPQIAQVHEQWPVVGRQDLYYGGTGYENRHGLGVQLQPGVLSGRWTAPSNDGAVPDEQTRPTVGEGEILLAPVTRLYDRGTTLSATPLLAARTARPEIWLSPATAAALGLAGDDTVSLPLEGSQFAVQVRVVDTLPDGVGLVPRSVGVPITAAQAVKIERVADTVAR
jgi:NADH-quinone oxidoreductase subunit G